MLWPLIGTLSCTFALFCGAYSQYRSKHLAKPCSLAPSKQGREALNNILAGKRPDRHVITWKARQGTKPFLKPKAKPKPLSRRVISRTFRKGPVTRMPPPDFTCKAATPVQAPSPGECTQCKRLGGEQLGRCICDDIAVAALNNRPFSLGRAKEAVTCPPCNTQGTRPSPVGQTSQHLACPKHRFGKAWTIEEYCKECDALALAALASTSSQ